MKKKINKLSEAETLAEKTSRASAVSEKINAILKDNNCEIIAMRIEVEGQPVIFKKEIIAK